MYNFLPHTDEIRKEMLESIGVSCVEDLFRNINPGVRLREPLDIPEGISELEAQKKLTALSRKNKSSTGTISFLGGGTYNRFIPSCISTIVQRSEFITAYTPYQPEISQGTLQVMYEYQSMLCNLTGMDVANASVYDGATACAEALFMAVRIKKKNKVLVASTLNPEYKKVIDTYCFGAGIEVDYLPQKNYKIDITRLDGLENEYAAILIQTPNYFGSIEDFEKISEVCKELKALFIACVDPVSLAVLKAPADYEADIAVGDVQPLGISQSFGGPHGGFIACKTAYMRQLPGRIAGMTVDKKGERAFTLTLQAREQHIRREKATSNICSNQALMALTATIYLSVMGAQGLREAALISTQRAHFLANKIKEIAGFSILNEDFLYEFVVKVSEKISVSDLLKELEGHGVHAGISLEQKFENCKNSLLICVTEMNNIDDIYLLLKLLRDISARYEF